MAENEAINKTFAEYDENTVMCIVVRLGIEETCYSIQNVLRKSLRKITKTSIQIGSLCGDTNREPLVCEVLRFYHHINLAFNASTHSAFRCVHTQHTLNASTYCQRAKSRHAFVAIKLERKQDGKLNQLHVSAT
jgi:hypothetical protein